MNNNVVLVTTRFAVIFLSCLDHAKYYEREQTNVTALLYLQIASALSFSQAVIKRLTIILLSYPLIIDTGEDCPLIGGGLPSRTTHARQSFSNTAEGERAFLPCTLPRHPQSREKIQW